MHSITTRMSSACSVRTLYTLALAMLLLALPFSTAHAADGPRQYDIPAGKLSSALSQFAAQAEILLSVDAAITGDQQSEGLQGRFSTEQGLQNLLQDTGLDYRQEGNGYIVFRATVQESGEIQLAPIMVEGERVERSIFDTASSVFVVDARQIERNPSLREIDDVLNMVPNISTFGTSNQAPTIRGISAGSLFFGGNAFLSGQRNRASIVVDGRPITPFELLNSETSAFDTQQVELFRGPQTTAQGTNSIAGAVYIVTADPTFEPELIALTEVGNHQNRRYALAVSGPLIDDELAARLTIDYQNRDSVLNGIPELTSDNSVDTDEFLNLTFRGKLLWEPKSIRGLSTQLTFNRNYTEQPTQEPVSNPVEDLNFATGPFTFPDTFSIEVNSITHEISYALNQNLELQNTFTYSRVDVDKVADGFAPDATIDQDQINQELTLNWLALDGRLSGLLGAAYSVNDSDDTLVIVGQTSFFEDKLESFGVFGEATFDVTDKLDVTAGLRYQRDTQDKQGLYFGNFFEFDNESSALLPKVSVGYDFSEKVRVGFLIARGYSPGATGVLPNVFAVPPSIEFYEFDEETVWNYELFARTSLFDDRLRLDANIFYADLRDFQRSTLVDIPGGPPANRIDNADKAESYGLELSAIYLPTDQLQLSGSLGLLETGIKEFSASLDPTIEDTEFGRAPGVTLSLGLEYKWLSGFSLAGNLRYSGAYFSDDANTPAERVPSYTVTDLRLGYEANRFEAYAYLDNAFNEIYPVLITGDGSNNFIGQPREFGVGLRISL